LTKAIFFLNYLTFQSQGNTMESDGNRDLVLLQSTV